MTTIKANADAAQTGFCSMETLPRIAGCPAPADLILVTYCPCVQYVKCVVYDEE